MAYRKLLPGSRLKCSIKPNRSKRRRFSAADVGRVACYARDGGVTRAELLKALEKCAPCEEKDEKRLQRQLLEMLAANTDVLSQSNTALVAVEIALTGFLLLSRFVPVLKGPSLVLSAARVSVAQLVRVIGRQKAANDAIYQEVLRRAA